MQITYLSTFLEFLCFYFTIRALLQLSFKPTRIDWIALGIILIALGTLPAKYSTLAWILGQLLYYLYSNLMKRKDLLGAALLFSLSFEFVMVVQFLAALVLMLLPLKLTDDNMGLAGNLTTLLLIFLLFQIRFLRSIYQRINQSALPYRLILLNSYLVLLSLLLLFKIHPERLLTNLGSILVIVSILVAANACVLYYDQRTIRQNQELASYQKNLPIYESLIHEIRENQHEYSNRIQNLQNLKETCKDYDTLSAALSRYANQYSKPMQAYPLLQISCPLLAATLYNHYCRAESAGISMQFDIVSEKLYSHASETQLADFVSTLTQNAIEACSSGDNIYIHLASKNGELDFEIRNPSDTLLTAEDITKFFQKNFTTKKDLIKADGVPHGVGLYQCMRVITKLGGTIGADGVNYSGKNWVIFRFHV